MVSDDAFAAVLGQAQADFRVRLMEMVQPGAVVLHLPAVPAEIMVVALHVREPVHGAVDGRHGHMGDGGQPGGVQLLAQGVQLPMVLHQPV